jgi:hypothetical protein
MKKVLRLIYSLLFALILYQFFLRFSLWNFKELNSDHAIHILMGESFDWGKDWYYWGQNRLGSFIPLIGSLFIGLGLNSFTALGVTQSILSLLIVLLLRLSIRSHLVFLAATAVVLLPIYPFWMQVTTGHPYLSQILFNLLLLACFGSQALKNRSKAILLPLLAMLSLWASELSLAFLLAIVLVEYKALWQIIKEQAIPVIISTAVGFSFLYFAKSNAVSVASYARLFTSPQNVLSALSDHLHGFNSALLFDTNMPFNGLLIWAYIVSFCICGILYFKRKRWALAGLKGKTKTLILAAVISFILIILANWSQQMGNPLRYYTYSYILLALGFLTFLDQSAKKLPGVSILAMLVGALTLNASIQFNNDFETGSPDRITKQEAELLITKLSQELPSEESISVIGSYWNTYLIDALSEQIIAIPHKGAQIRDYRNLDQIRVNKYFILIGNDWLDTFPLKIEQHQLKLTMVKSYANLGKIKYALYKRSFP